MSSDRDLFMAYTALMVGALVPIYHGAYASLRTPQSTLKALKEKRAGQKAGADDEDSDDEDESVALPETLTSEDAYWLPVIGSVVLFSMFLVFKYSDKIWVDRVLGFYFAGVGTFAVSRVLFLLARGSGAFRLLTATKYNLTKTSAATSKAKAKTEELFRLRLTVLHPILITMACSLVGIYLYTKHWIPSNVLALSLSLSSISMLSLDSFQTGSIMLMGLFLYDIFWVFGTNVMVSVARGFDGPIKIVWPKNLLMGLMDANVKWQMTMLGLGDIVIPGIFIALALRFDQHQYIQANQSKLITKRDVEFAKPYFQATMIAYVVGLATTMGVMHFTKAAQPALLYLSPACIAAVGLCAVKRGEVKEMWAWKDEAESEDKSKVGKTDEKEEVSEDDETSASTLSTSKPSTRSSRRRIVSSSKE
ncbi:hypothetical protein CBS101457_004556 [Exobasidium rhododendri]|nr:hypothetical protein CBS101457_004556 [Exobasidium rhododendri]